MELRRSQRRVGNNGVSRRNAVPVTLDTCHDQRFDWLHFVMIEPVMIRLHCALR